MNFSDYLQSPQMGLAMRLLAAAGPQAQPMSFGQRAFGAIQGQQQDELNRQLTLAKIASLYAGKKASKETLPDRLKILARKMSVGSANEDEKYEFDLLRSANQMGLITSPILRGIRETPAGGGQKYSKSEEDWIKNAQLKNPKLSRDQVIKEGKKRGRIR